MASGHNGPVAGRQSRLIRSWLRRPNHFPDHFCTAFRIESPLDVNALRLAMGDVLAVHSALRANFDEDGKGVVTARLLNPDQFGIDIIALRDASEVEASARSMAAAMDRAGFAVDRPLFRAVLLTDGRLYHLLICAHHSIIDGGSLDPLSRSLAIAYQARHPDFYDPHAERCSRSMMNVTFRLHDRRLESPLVTSAPRDI